MAAHHSERVTSTAALTAFEAELAIRDAPVPKSIPDATLQAPGLALSADEFLLSLPNGLAFHYVRGGGVAIRQPQDVTDAEVRLYFDGSVSGAVAWINGLLPLHASGVVEGGRVHAVTGDSGAGKSTLVMALCAGGLLMQADDLLLLDISAGGRVPPMCLPGRKPLKLWRDALDLAGGRLGPRVRPDMDKYFVVPPGGSSGEVLPLDRIYFLRDSAGALPTIREFTAAEALSATPRMLFRPHYYSALATPETHWRMLTRIAANVRCFEFSRPIDRKRFDAGVRMLEGHIRGEA